MVWTDGNFLAIETEPFNLSRVPEPHRSILHRDVEKLKLRDDVLAIGVAGSVAYGDMWPGSDLDIEVVLKGDKPKQIVTTEQEISVDYGYFGETKLNEIPYDTSPVYDPTGKLERELSSRDVNKIVSGDIAENLSRSEDLLARGETALGKDPYSALVFVHLAAWRINLALTLAAGENRTIRRAVSRLEKALRKAGRLELLEPFGSLLGFPQTLEKAEEILRELQNGYREVWGFFKGKNIGPVYMQLQPDSGAWFHNRIRPLYDHDKRDLVAVVYEEFPFVLYYLLQLLGHEKTPLNVFKEAEKLQGPPALWVARYRHILGFFEAEKIPSLLATAKMLLLKANELSKAGLWKKEISRVQTENSDKS